MRALILAVILGAPSVAAIKTPGGIAPSLKLPQVGILEDHLPPAHPGPLMESAAPAVSAIPTAAAALGAAQPAVEAASQGDANAASKPLDKTFDNKGSGSGGGGEGSGGSGGGEDSVARLNVVMAEVLRPYNTPTTKAGFVFRSLELNDRRAVKASVAFSFDKTGPRGRFFLGSQDVHYNFPDHWIPEGEEPMPMLNGDVMTKFDFLKVFGRKELDRFGRDAEKSVKDVVKSLYGDAAQEEAWTNPGLDDQGHLATFGIRADVDVDLAKLPTAEIAYGSMELLTTLQGAFASVAAILNPGYYVFESGAPGLKEFVEKIMARDPATLGLMARIAESLDYFATQATEEPPAQAAPALEWDEVEPVVPDGSPTVKPQDNRKILEGTIRAWDKGRQPDFFDFKLVMKDGRDIPLVDFNDGPYEKDPRLKDHLGQRVVVMGHEDPDRLFVDYIGTDKELRETMEQLTGLLIGQLLHPAQVMVPGFTMTDIRAVEGRQVLVSVAKRSELKAAKEFVERQTWLGPFVRYEVKTPRAAKGVVASGARIPPVTARTKERIIKTYQDLPDLFEFLWQSELPEVVRYARVHLFRRSGETFTALIPVGRNDREEISADPNVAGWFILERKGRTGGAAYSRIISRD